MYTPPLTSIDVTGGLSCEPMNTLPLREMRPPFWTMRAVEMLSTLLAVTPMRAYSVTANVPSLTTISECWRLFW